MTLVLDASVLVEIVLGEPRAEALVTALSRRPGRVVVGAATLLEAGIVVEARAGEEARDDLAAVLAELEVEVVPFDELMAREGQRAWSRFGKGRHPAALNLGDCFSYALTQVEDGELMFLGDDFAQTDVRAVRT